MFAKRLFDIVTSAIALLILSPVLFACAVWISIDSPGGFFYRQERVGRNGKLFYMLKFRSMFTGSDSKGLLTVGNNDVRITRSGNFLRKTKLDELPQLINVFIGDMSFVGPRPEVLKYVRLYSDEQKKVLEARPGITDLASIQYRNENEVLAKFDNPEQAYITQVMPDKLRINLEYLAQRNFLTDIKIILKTVSAIIK